MSQIFLSYKRENKESVQRVVQALRAAGLSLWWDQDITPDAPWEQTIERELEASKVVIVAWSQAAVASENVKAEARRARNQGKLIQIFVEPCEPPLFFGERQGVDLSSWNGDAGDHRFQTVLTAVRAILEGKRPPQGVGYAPKKRAPWAMLTALFVIVTGALSFVSNLGGARDAICSVSAAHQACLDWGLIAQIEAPESVEDQQARLVNAVSGTWGRLDRNCADTITYAVSRGDDGVYRINGTAPGFESLMQVTSIDVLNGAINARGALPNEAGIREVWEYKPSGDQLVMLGPEGRAESLGRCAAP